MVRLVSYIKDGLGDNYDLIHQFCIVRQLKHMKVEIATNYL